MQRGLNFNFSKINYYDKSTIFLNGYLYFFSFILRGIFFKANINLKKYFKLLANAILNQLKGFSNRGTVPTTITVFNKSKTKVVNVCLFYLHFYYCRFATKIFVLGSLNEFSIEFLYFLINYVHEIKRTANLF